MLLPIHPIATVAFSDEAKLSLPQCLKCGKLLVNHASRHEVAADGKPEVVHVYLCFTHGFFTFRSSTGLTHGF
jgi:hypothetical protein